jgi:Uma2 family endonuclease
MLFVLQTQPKTVADYKRMPEGAPMQLIDGEFIMSPAPRFFHQYVSAQLLTELKTFVMARNLGVVVAAPTDVYLSATDVYQPDILFVARENFDSIRDDGVHGAPDLVIEILSASTAYYDEHRKKEIYLEKGVEEYWLVDPMVSSIEILRNKGSEFRSIFLGKEGRACSEVVQDFCVDVAKVFEQPA